MPKQKRFVFHLINKFNEKTMRVGLLIFFFNIYMYIYIKYFAEIVKESVTKPNDTLWGNILKTFFQL